MRRNALKQASLPLVLVDPSAVAEVEREQARMAEIQGICHRHRASVTQRHRPGACVGFACFAGRESEGGLVHAESSAERTLSV